MHASTHASITPPSQQLNSHRTAQILIADIGNSLLCILSLQSPPRQETSYCLMLLQRCGPACASHCTFILLCPKLCAPALASGIDVQMWQDSWTGTRSGPSKSHAARTCKNRQNRAGQCIAACSTQHCHCPNHSELRKRITATCPPILGGFRTCHSNYLRPTCPASGTSPASQQHGSNSGHCRQDNSW